MGNTVTALSLGIALEEFAYLEKEHHKHGLRKLCLCPWQETDAERTDGGYRHEEMFVEDISVE